ncbi:MAG: NAD(P)-dependent oxidoreductase, partial [Candidatus Dormiibacterota bacterium]
MTNGSYYPVALDLQDRRCVVLGGNEEAARKLPPLLEAGATVIVIASAAVPAIEKAARAGDLRWEPRDYREGDLAGAHLAIDASDDAATNRG